MQCGRGDEVNAVRGEVMWLRMRPILPHSYSYLFPYPSRLRCEGDARTHRTPKALACEINASAFLHFAPALEVRGLLAPLSNMADQRELPRFKNHPAP